MGCRSGTRSAALAGAQRHSGWRWPVSASSDCGWTCRTSRGRLRGARRCAAEAQRARSEGTATALCQPARDSIGRMRRQRRVGHRVDQELHRHRHGKAQERHGGPIDDGRPDEARLRFQEARDEPAGFRERQGRVFDRIHGSRTFQIGSSACREAMAPPCCRARPWRNGKTVVMRERGADPEHPAHAGLEPHGVRSKRLAVHRRACGGCR